MCLFTEDRKARIAEEDIECYKLLVYLPLTNKYVSPYQSYFEWDVNNRKAVTNKEKTSKMPAVVSGVYEIEGGVFHTFKKVDPVAKFIFEREDSVKPKLRYALALCVIPKGSKYYSGWTRSRQSPWEESYASKKLIIKEVSFAEEVNKEEEWFGTVFVDR